MVFRPNFESVGISCITQICVALFVLRFPYSFTVITTQILSPKAADLALHSPPPSVSSITKNDSKVGFLLKTTQGIITVAGGFSGDYNIIGKAHAAG